MKTLTSRVTYENRRLYLPLLFCGGCFIPFLCQMGFHAATWRLMKSFCSFPSFFDFWNCTFFNHGFMISNDVERSMVNFRNVFIGSSWATTYSNRCWRCSTSRNYNDQSAYSPDLYMPFWNRLACLVVRPSLCILLETNPERFQVLSKLFWRMRKPSFHCSLSIKPEMDAVAH